MPEPVEIRFTQAGLPQILQAFDTIEARMLRLEQHSTREAERGAQSRVRTAKTEAEGRERATTKAAQTEVRVEAEATKEKERLDRYLDGVRRRSSEAAGRLAEKEANTEIREAERSARAAKRELEKLEEFKARVRIRSAEMAGRAAAAEVEAEQSARRRVSRAIGSATTGGLGRMAGTAASLAGGALAIGGGFALADIAGKEMAAERTAALLVNAVTTGKGPPPGANVGAILAQASGVARETGMSKGDLIAGTLEYSRKARGGDFTGAMANMGFFARMAKTTGTDINDIAAAAGTLQSQNPDLKAPEMQQMLLDVYAQGKAGSMSMIDVAKQVGILSSTRSSFAGNAADNQRKLLALGQLAAPEGTVEEAGTFIKNMSAEAGAHRKSTKDTVGLEQMGVKFDKFGRMESPEQMISAVFKGTGGDITKIEKIFGLRGTALFRSLQPAFVAAGGGEAGVQAVQAKMASVTGATMTAGNLDAQFAQLMSTPGERFQKAMTEVSEVVAMRLEPMMERLADTLTRNEPSIEKLLGSMMDLAEFFIANPFAGIGTVVSAAIMKDIAGAAIGQALKTSLGMGLSNAFAGLAVASAALTIGIATIELMAQRDVNDQRRTIAGQLDATNVVSQVHADIRQRRVTSKDVEDVQRQIAEQEAVKKKQEEEGRIYRGAPAAGGGGLNFPAIMQSLGLDSAGAARHKAEMENTTRTLNDLRKAAEQLRAAMLHVAVASNTSPDNPSRHAPIDKRPP